MERTLVFCLKIAKVCPIGETPTKQGGAAFSSSSLSHGHKRHHIFFIPPPFFPLLLPGKIAAVAFPEEEGEENKRKM